MPESLEPLCKLCDSLDDKLPVVVVVLFTPVVSICGVVEFKLLEFLEFIEPMSLCSTGGGDALCTVECLGLILAPDCRVITLDFVGDTRINELAEFCLFNES